MLAHRWSTGIAHISSRWTMLFTALLFIAHPVHVQAMRDDLLRSLRNDTRNLFYHGYENYIAHAFPEDELRPISCQPQTRNRQNPADIGLNDVLGNYSLTLVDSLSTLAIFASDDEKQYGNDALREFQAGIEELVRLYGDGSEKGRCGERACGFDLDSKVQVFETNIRGVGGLLSAHLFAIGELPIRNYNPEWERDELGREYIRWPDFEYDGQLLRLAYDLASRLLPAFNTTTGLPYPRVNLRHGIPFYMASDTGTCRLDGTSNEPREITETCAAGAGSLVLEFSTLSRLTGDGRFEKLAKRAFWAVWSRRSSIDLVGNGIDAETGQWTNPTLAGIGAGIDSWFEYAVKTHVLLSGLPYDPNEATENDPDKFLEAWTLAHDAVKRHIYKTSSADRHAFYGQADLYSGAPRYTWIDNLSAYYPGLLTLSGELEEAIESHLLYAALWTRYGALPERWHTFNSYIDPNFRHWAGRPEFIESTYYLHQATKDPWYLHVGEMALRDIRRRCWTKCGWADLGDVISGEKRDRMESFFLGETAKYLYLLFNEKHPLNTKDAPIIFTTEGHPLVIPRRRRLAQQPKHNKFAKSNLSSGVAKQSVCPSPLPPLPFTVSNIANRSDLFHAAALAQLHLVPVDKSRSSPLSETSSDSPGVSYADIRSPTNYTYYPWTLPTSLIPPQASSVPARSAVLSTLTFPNLQSDDKGGVLDRNMIPWGALDRVLEGVLVNSLSNLRLSMVQEQKNVLLPDERGSLVEMHGGAEYRIHGIANYALGRDEKVLLSTDALNGVSPADPHFTKVKDREMVDLVIDVPNETEFSDETDAVANATNFGSSVWSELDKIVTSILSGPTFTEHAADPEKGRDASSRYQRFTIPAILPTGIGAAPLPSTVERHPSVFPIGYLPFRTIYFLNSPLCERLLPLEIARDYNVLVILRGGCSFAEKLAKIPATPPTTSSLHFVVIISPESTATGADSSERLSSELIRPLLDERQKTSDGEERQYPLALLMIEGFPNHLDILLRAASTRGYFDDQARLVEDKSQHAGSEASVAAPGLTIKRRYWFESLGIPIANLVML